MKVVDKTPARHTKRNATGEAQTAYAPTADGRGARRGGYSGNDGGEKTFYLESRNVILAIAMDFLDLYFNSS